MQVGQHGCDLVAHPRVANIGTAAEPQRQHESGGYHHDHGHRSQQRVVDEQDDRDHHQRERLHGDVDETFLEQQGERLYVAGHAGHQHARFLFGVEIQREPLQMREDPHPQLVQEPLSEPAGEGSAGVSREHLQNYCPQKHHAHHEEHAELPRQHAVVYADLGEQRAGLQRQGLQDHQQTCQHQLRLVGGEEASHGERAHLGLLVRELDDRLRVFRLCLQQLAGTVGHLGGNARERQAGGGVGLGRAGAAAPVVSASEAHQSASSVIPVSVRICA